MSASLCILSSRPGGHTSPHALLLCLTAWEASLAPCDSQTLSHPYYHSKKDVVKSTTPPESLGQLAACNLQEGDPEGWWQESFKSHTDSKPMGPEAISMDLTFHGSPHLYGLPEHATSLSLRPTVGEPSACSLKELPAPVHPAPVPPACAACQSLSAVRPCSPLRVGESLCLLGTFV